MRVDVSQYVVQNITKICHHSLKDSFKWVCQLVGVVCP